MVKHDIVSIYIYKNLKDGLYKIGSGTLMSPSRGKVATQDNKRELDKVPVRCSTVNFKDTCISQLRYIQELHSMNVLLLA